MSGVMRCLRMLHGRGIIETYEIAALSAENPYPSPTGVPRPYRDRTDLVHTAVGPPYLITNVQFLLRVSPAHLAHVPDTTS